MKKTEWAFLILIVLVLLAVVGLGIYNYTLKKNVYSLEEKIEELMLSSQNSTGQEDSKKTEPTENKQSSDSTQLKTETEKLLAKVISGSGLSFSEMTSDKFDWINTNLSVSSVNGKSITAKNVRIDQYDGFLKYIQGAKDGLALAEDEQNIAGGMTGESHGYVQKASSVVCTVGISYSKLWQGKYDVTNPYAETLKLTCGEKK